MRGFQSNQKMHMVGNTAHAFGKTTQTTNGAAEVFMQTISPIRMNERDAILRAEDDVAMQAQVG